MYYAPHILQIRVIQLSRDELGRIIPSSHTEEWRTLGSCRCDDDTTVEERSENGEVFRSKYHVVCDTLGVKSGDYIRCIANGVTRGEGRVMVVKSTNYFNYTEIWM